MASWVIAGLALLLALMTILSVRRLARRLDTLNQSYWELRYEYTRLRSRLSRLDPEQPDAEQPEPHAPPVASPGVSFVPLSTIRKKEK